jgi:hypothetical protein
MDGARKVLLQSVRDLDIRQAITPTFEMPKAVGREAKGLSRILLGTRAEIEATRMNKDANPPAGPEQKLPLGAIITILFVTVFFVLVLLLGISMVHHRFFQGERVHRNGSVGQ